MQSATADRTLCFVIMPFREDMGDVYEIIGDVVTREHQLTCLRGDDISTAGVVIEQVWERIKQAQILIADATGGYPNVFYEIGLAHGSGKEPIIYTHNDEGRAQLARKLSAFIEDLKWKRPRIRQWINTTDPSIKIGLAYPIHNEPVDRRVIPAYGQVIGLSSTAEYNIACYLVTDQTYDQGTSLLDNHGYWQVDPIYLSTSSHKFFMRVFHESGLLKAESDPITVLWRES